ncbi:TonB-dependent receptor [Fibrella aquatilis]|uniref:TonB-dependent receptor n=1 Tax=Fibrella aquatilis TaxID=2817059 RepID=A0A939G7D3_9BACT|nr:TonB-dependent receptor [Fibrella aquatilis]MBO0931128.1 TonB-dependent receptor [Fibrella aquatilis]
MKYILTLCCLLSALLLQAQSIDLRGTVADANTNQPIPGVNITVRNGTGTATDANGRFGIRVNPGAVLTFSSVGFQAQEYTVTARQTEIRIMLQPGNTDLDAVVVVGSRSNSRTVLTSAVPVDVLPVKTLQRTLPQNDLNQLLTYIAPSFQSNRQTSSDGTEHIDPASLRGLGPDQTLVLINGKRRHTTSLLNNQGTFGNGTVGTDLNAIPTAAIERIEILRDGASAQYGSDAIAGVINIILKKNTGQFEQQLTGGTTKQGDGQLLKYNANYGTNLGRNGGFINLSLEAYGRGSTNRTQNNDLIIFDQSANDYYFAYPFAGDNGADAAKSRALDDQVLKQKGLNRDDFNFHVGDAGIRNVNTFLNLGLPLKGGKGEFYAFGGYNYRRGTGYGFRRLPSSASQMVYSIFPNGFQPNTGSDIQDRSLAVGFRYKLGEWQMDLSNTLGNNRFDFDITNTVNASLQAKSPTSFQAGGHAFTQNTVNLDFARYLTGVASGLNVALGAEFRAEQYRIRAGQEESWRNYGFVTDPASGTVSNPSGLAGGAQSFPGFTPANAGTFGRSNVAIYSDNELEITKKWLVEAAGRFENYTDFGSTFNYKLASRLTLTDGINLRGAFSTGFRAPSLHQQHFSYVSTTLLTNGLLGNSGIFTNDSPVAQALGIPKLKQETSQNISLGLALRPVSNLSISVDAYRIRVENRIVLTGLFGFTPFGEPVAAIQKLLLPFQADGARFFANAINTTTQGLDVVVNHSTNLGSGRLTTTLSGNFNRTKADDQFNLPTRLAGQEDVFFSPNERGLIEVVNPRQKINLLLNFTGTKFGVTLANVYFGEATRNGFPYGPVQTFSGKVVTDLSLSYTLRPALTLTAGANNLLNVYPDQQAYGNSYFGVFKYAPVQMGMNGAFYFVRLVSLLGKS